MVPVEGSEKVQICETHSFFVASLQSPSIFGEDRRFHQNWVPCYSAKVKIRWSLTPLKIKTEPRNPPIESRKVIFHPPPCLGCMWIFQGVVEKRIGPLFVAGFEFFSHMYPVLRQWSASLGMEPQVMSSLWHHGWRASVSHSDTAWLRSFRTEWSF